MSASVLVVGAGAQGKIISTWLSRWPEIDTVRIADIDRDTVQRHVARLDSDKVTAHHLDASDLDAVTSLCQDVDLLVAAITSPFLLGLMDVALATATHYHDLAYGPPYSLLDEQLARDAEFRDAGLTALLCAGQSPGLTGLIVAHAADLCDELRAVRIRMFDRVDGAADLATWSAETLFSDCSLPPLVFHDGELTTAPPFSGEEIYEFPPPFGPQRVVQHIHEEVQLMSHFLGHRGLRDVDVKLGGPDVADIEVLIKAGLWSDKPVDIDGVLVEPRKLMARLLPRTPSADDIERLLESGELIDSSGVLVVEVDTVTRGWQATYTFSVTPPTLREAHRIIPGATHESYVTGTSAAVFAKAITLGRIPARGVFSAETFGLESRRYVLEELAAAGIRVRESVSSWLI